MAFQSTSLSKIEQDIQKLMTSNFEFLKFEILTYFLKSFVYKINGEETCKFSGLYSFFKSDLRKTAFNSS